MAGLVITTNTASLTAQANLTKATNALNKSIERMTTGFKINSAKDDAAGYAIVKNWETQLSSLDVAADNAATGLDMLTTMEDTYALINDHLQRVRDLTEQAANGTYGSSSKAAIQSEIQARLEEVGRIANSSEFNGIKLMDGSRTSAVNLQVGIYGDNDSKISLEASIFASAKVDGLFGTGETAETVAKKCAGTDDAHSDPADMLGNIDAAMKSITNRVTKIGAYSNRVESAVDLITVQTENLTSSKSTLKDADIAEESSNYVTAQILQQAATTLLATANQQPSIALNLI